MASCANRQRARRFVDAAHRRRGGRDAVAIGGGIGPPVDRRARRQQRGRGLAVLNGVAGVSRPSDHRRWRAADRHMRRRSPVRVAGRAGCDGDLTRALREQRQGACSGIDGADVGRARVELPRDAIRSGQRRGDAGRDDPHRAPDRCRSRMVSVPGDLQHPIAGQDLDQFGYRFAVSELCGDRDAVGAGGRVGRDRA